VTTFEEDLRYLFALERVERAPDGTFTLYAPKESGRTIFRVTRERMLSVVAVRWIENISYNAWERKVDV